jgi:hypothetical protein
VSTFSSAYWQCTLLQNGQAFSVCLNSLELLQVAALDLFFAQCLCDSKQLDLLLTGSLDQARPLFKLIILFNKQW